MAKVLPGATDLDKLHALCELPYKEQVVWFLNAYWEQFASNEAEKVWAYVEKCTYLFIYSSNTITSKYDKKINKYIVERF